MSPKPSPRAESGLRVLGHPVHPMLSDFPMVLLLAGAACDAGAWATREPVLSAVSYWATAAGLAFAALTATAGLVDYAAIANGAERAQRDATRHMIAMLSAVGAFAATFAVRDRRGPGEGAGAAILLALDAAGAFGLVVGGWFGGELVFFHGVGTAHPPEDDAKESPRAAEAGPHE